MEIFAVVFLFALLLLPIFYVKGRTRVGMWLFVALVSIPSLEGFFMAAMVDSMAYKLMPLLTPLVPLSLVIAIMIKPDHAALERRALREGKARSCPYCSKIIVLDAVFCPGCARQLPTKES